MPRPVEAATASFQAQFHQRWNYLVDPHVRTLAWLLDAPDLLDPDAPSWHGRVATLGLVDEQTENWLAALDRSPEKLQAYLGLGPFTRLGRYAEKLMAFYLEYKGVLHAHGVQVRADKNDTIGEFDFLLRQDKALVHWEFATKLYLLEASGQGCHADYFVGPNLADTLGAKVRKIMDRQLSLSQHPAAQPHLPQPVVAAQALVKGWLFYYGQTPLPMLPPGISRMHCRGFWCPLHELERLEAEHYIILSRLDWLAPAKTVIGRTLNKVSLTENLRAHFSDETSPVLVAIMQPMNGNMLEINRGFIVPDDWNKRAGLRVRSGA
ncbi:MAG TPA: DUF1853 family protein [Noviherbaspirillum sp.]|nr:DUF1853 family protein [Noviherbaspirillum sp.]